jgi:tetratricopeptide (TPR) repeat protein
VPTPDEPDPREAPAASAVTGPHTESWLPDDSTGPLISAPTPVFGGTVPGWPAGMPLLEDFIVEGVLGEGGMGIVYRVRQLSTGQRLAVKRARLLHPEQRRLFLAELRTWLDLPDHPHLAPCRFFRTVADEVVIFTDHADGGSLADAIRKHKLTGTVELLDLAIQVAWGLHALHEQGLVHQDVKPANVLLAADGTARVADFGLARARCRVHPTAEPTAESHLLTAGPMTPAYCSPEQYARLPISRKTDVWSWGVTLLEMFAGKVPCCSAGGHRAAEVLEQHAPTLGEALADVVGRCLKPTPADRWPTLVEAADALANIYREQTGADYPRKPPVSKRSAPTFVRHDRHTAAGERWDPPRKWLGRAFEASGRDPTEAEAHVPAPSGTRRAQAVADLAVYEEARAILERKLSAEGPEHQAVLAALCVQKAFVHTSLDDRPGALALFDRALELWEDLITVQGQRQHTASLARTLLHKADTLRVLGETAEAVPLYDRVVALWERLDNRKRRRELREDLAEAHLNKGVAVRSLGDLRTALDLFDRAIDLWEEVVNRDHQEEAANDLARAYLTKASAVSVRGDAGAALTLCDEAIKIRRRLVQRDGRRELEADLARAYLQKANVLRMQSNVKAALPVYDLALGLWERLVQQEGRDDLAHDLARSYLGKANAVRTVGQPAEAAALCGRAAAIWERLVQREGRQELSPELAKAYLHQGNALRAAGQAAEALARCDQALVLLERLVHEQGRTELRNDLARAYIARAHALHAAGESQQALALFDQAIALRTEVCKESPREDVQGDLAKDLVSRAELRLELGQRDEARAELTEAANRLQALARGSRRNDLNAVLQRARRLLKRFEGGSD